MKPVTYDLPNHTVTISEFKEWNTLPVTSMLHTTHDDMPKSKKSEDEVEK